MAPATITRPTGSSLGESFFFIADSTHEASERERRLQDELARVKNEFQKVQTLLDKMLTEQQKQQHIAKSKATHSSVMHGSVVGGLPGQSLAREAHLKASLRENYLMGSEVHLSKSELEAEVKRLKEQLTGAERRNAEWAVKWDQVKQKASMKKRSESNGTRLGSTPPPTLISSSLTPETASLVLSNMASSSHQ